VLDNQLSHVQPPDLELLDVEALDSVPLCSERSNRLSTIARVPIAISHRPPQYQDSQPQSSPVWMPFATRRKITLPALLFVPYRPISVLALR